jgi:hypothetical protein
MVRLTSGTRIPSRRAISIALSSSGASSAINRFAIRVRDNGKTLQGGADSRGDARM